MCEWLERGTRGEEMRELIEKNRGENISMLLIATNGHCIIQLNFKEKKG